MERLCGFENWEFLVHLELTKSGVDIFVGETRVHKGLELGRGKVGLVPRECSYKNVGE